ncbi:hypothetical protein [Dyella mobilis]|uniref:Type VI secretion system (T6SS), amidase effector protein 4 n=1 Tax=Dyella mobilis TaxID=1849582 RepID=A0ABS2KIS3_9GAMM|nr:hypothetical protein [Dyella mobilis]MBM7130979.1 hypothetical protein [Dyella mobilis]
MPNPGAAQNPNAAATQSQDPNAAKAPDPAAVQNLLTTAHKAYTLFPNNCSGSVHYVINQLVDPDAKYLLANQLLASFEVKGSGWRKVTLEEASRLADQGQVVVGGLVEARHGHVVIVLPGKWKSSGGYTARGKVMPHTGQYPLVMSTALGDWPGAKSDGDKTVFDPWGDRKTFQKVTFWTKAPAP